MFFQCILLTRNVLINVHPYAPCSHSIWTSHTAWQTKNRGMADIAYGMCGTLVMIALPLGVNCGLLLLPLGVPEAGFWPNYVFYCKHASLLIPASLFSFTRHVTLPHGMLATIVKPPMISPTHTPTLSRQPLLTAAVFTSPGLTLCVMVFSLAWSYFLCSCESLASDHIKRKLVGVVICATVFGQVLNIIIHLPSGASPLPGHFCAGPLLAFAASSVLILGVIDRTSKQQILRRLHGRYNKAAASDGNGDTVEDMQAGYVAQRWVGSSGRSLGHLSASRRREIESAGSLAICTDPDETGLCTQNRG